MALTADKPSASGSRILSPAHGLDSRSIQSGYSTSCSTHVLQEALRSALQIKKNMRTRSNMSPNKKSTTTKPTRTGKENCTVKNSEEQAIVDLCWNRLLNGDSSANTSTASYNYSVLEVTGGYYNRNPGACQMSSPHAKVQTRPPCGPKPGKMRGGVVEIVTTKAKSGKNARSLSPIAERSGARSPSPTGNSKKAKFELPQRSKNFCFAGPKKTHCASPRLAVQPPRHPVPAPQRAQRGKKGLVFELTENETAQKTPASPLQRMYLIARPTEERPANPLDSPMQTPGRAPMSSATSGMNGSVCSSSSVTVAVKKSYGTARPEENALGGDSPAKGAAKRQRRRRDERKKAQAPMLHPKAVVTAVAAMNKGIV